MAGHASSGATATKFSDSDDRVGIVSWDYGERARGGLGRAMAEMTNVLRGSGMSVVLPPRSYWLLVTRYSYIFFVYCFLQWWINSHRIRTVIVPTGPGGLYLFRKPKRCRLIVVCYHTYRQQARMVPGQWWKRLFIPFERRTLALADRVLCYCADTQRVLREECGLPEDRVRLLPQLFDVDAWHSPLPAKEPGLCIFVGRLDRRKGIGVLLRAWRNFQERQYAGMLECRPRLVIVGDGLYRREVRSLVAHCASAQWVPSLSRKELTELVQRAAIVLCPSYLEGFGLACAEAMAAGACVIASDCDGLRSLITHGETGWLVRPGDPEALANGLAALLRDAALRWRLAVAAQDDVRRRFVRADAARLLVLECA